MVLTKKTRTKTKPTPKAVRQRAAPLQCRLSVEQGDEGGQHAVTDAAKRQPHAVRSHAAQHMREGKMLAGLDGNGIFAPGEGKADGADKDGEHADGGQAPLRIEDDAERRGQRHAAVGADAVQADDLGGVLLAGGGDAPERGSR